MASHHGLGWTGLLRTAGASLAITTALCLTGCHAVDDRMPSDQRYAPGLGSYDSVMHIADATRGAGDINGALSLYRKASSLAPQRPEAELAIARCLLDLGRVDDAIESYREAVKLTKNGPDALRGLANAYLAARRPDLAMQPLETASALDPNDTKLLETLGVAADLAGDHRKAQTYYRRGTAIDSLNDGLVNNLALSLALSGDNTLAISTLKPIADGQRSTPRIRQTLSLIYGLSGNTDLAARYARRDLNEEDVAHNLAYFQTLRGLAPDARDRAVTAATWSPPRQGVAHDVSN